MLLTRSHMRSLRSERMNGKGTYLCQQFFAAISLVSLLSACFSCAGLRERSAGSRTTMIGRPQDVRIVESVDLKGSFRGRVYLEDRKIRFSGFMAMSGESKGRFELFTPLGRTAALLLFSDDAITFFLPERVTLWKGRSTSENLYKIFGMRMLPEHIINILNGMAQFHAALGQGSFVIEDVQEEDREKIHSLHEFQDFLIRNKKLFMRYVPGEDGHSLHVMSVYDIAQPFCESLVPSRCVVYDDDGMPVIEVAFVVLDDLSIHANGLLFCGMVSSEEQGYDSIEKDIYTDVFLYEIPGVKVVDLDAMESTGPIIGALYE